MSTALRFGGINIQRDYLNEHRRRVMLDVPEVTIKVFTPGGQVRDVPLTRGMLLDLIEGAVQALRATEPRP